MHKDARLLEEAGHLFFQALRYSLKLGLAVLALATVHAVKTGASAQAASLFNSSF